MNPPKPRGKGKGKGKGKGMGDGLEPVWPIKAGEAHDIKSCDTGALRYRADTPLNERMGAQIEIVRADIGPPRTDPVEMDPFDRSREFWSGTGDGFYCPPSVYTDSE